MYDKNWHLHFNAMLQMMSFIGGECASRPKGKMLPRLPLTKAAGRARGVLTKPFPRSITYILGKGCLQLAKSRRPRSSAKKGDQWVRGRRNLARPMGARLQQQAKSKANPLLLLNPLLQPLTLGSEVCSRLKFLGANGDVAQKPATPFRRQKRAPMGARLSKRRQRARPCQPLAQRLARCLLCLRVGRGGW